MVVDTVHVWLIRAGLPGPAVAGLRGLLDDDERRRAEEMVPERRDRYVVAHAATRLIVGDRLGVAPERLRWDRGPHGKPELAGAWGGCLRVNLSHSGEFAALAVTPRRSVGVDIQELSQVDACRLAERFFLPAEARFVAAAPGIDAQVARFTRLWTRKEACVKSAGGRLLQGMALPVRATSGVVHDPTGALPDSYLVRDIPAPDGFHMAVALAGADPFRVIRQWWRPPP